MTQPELECACSFETRLKATHFFSPIVSTTGSGQETLGGDGSQAKSSRKDSTAPLVPATKSQNRSVESTRLRNTFRNYVQPFLFRNPDIVLITAVSVGDIRAKFGVFLLKFMLQRVRLAGPPHTSSLTLR